MNKFFIGIDFSKQTFDATVLEDEKLTSDGIHQKFPNDKQGYVTFEKWICSINKHIKTSSIICGENTGIYSRNFCDYFSSKGYAVWLESALQIKRSLGLSRGKNDKKDSRDIAEYAARYSDKCRPYHTPSEQIDALCEMFTHRKLLVREKASIKRRRNELDENLRRNKWLKKSLRTDDKIIKVIDQEIKEIENQMMSVIESDTELKRNFDILTSMKGLALINAVAMLVYTDNFNRFDYDARKICSYWGVAPFASQSGTSLNGKPHVSGYADRYLKSLMSQAAICASRYCPAIKEYAIRLAGKGKHPSIIQNNCKNKMIHILVAMVKTGTKYGEKQMI